MSDIIQDAKQLLEGATPGPWKINGEFDPDCPELQGAPRVENGLIKVPVLSHDIYGDFSPEDADLIAAAPTNTRAIAGMEWEYQCQRLLAGAPDDWYTWLTTYSLESAKKQTKKHAAKQRARGYEPPSYRIRRRLVGDWEVINE